MRVARFAAVLVLIVRAVSPIMTAQRVPVGPVAADCNRACLEALNTGEVADMSSFAGRASSIHVTEAFRIENSMIRRVEMIGTGVPYHFNSSWGAGLSGK